MKENKRIIISAIILFMLTIIMGIYCASIPFKEAVKVALKTNITYSSLPFELKQPLNAAEIDDKLSEYNDYNGFVSTQALLTLDIKADNKTLDTQALLIDKYFDKVNVIDKENVAIDIGYCPAYVEGWMWRNAKVGDKLTTSLKRTTGEIEEIKLVIAGTSKMEIISSFGNGIKGLNTHRSAMIIDGLDINNYVTEPYSSVYILKDNMNDLVNANEFFQRNKLLSNEDLNSFMQITQLKQNMDLSIYKVVLYVLAIVVSFVTIWFVCGNKRTYGFLIFGGGITLFMTIIAFAKYRKDFLFKFIEYSYNNWFMAIIFSILGISICLIGLDLIIRRKTSGSVKMVLEKNNDKTSKYL
ncbi:MAG: hypothetical protein RR357_04565 [Clostridia bacterium]